MGGAVRFDDEPDHEGEEGVGFIADAAGEGGDESESLGRWEAAGGGRELAADFRGGVVLSHRHGGSEYGRGKAAGIACEPDGP